MKKNKVTQSLVNTFPAWSKVRSDDQSIGFQFLNALAKPIEKMERELERMGRNEFLATADLDEIDIAYRVTLPPEVDFELDLSDPTNPVEVPPLVSGEIDNTWLPITLAVDNDLETFWYESIPNRATLDALMSGQEIAITLNPGHYTWSGVAEHPLGGGRIWVETAGGVTYLRKNEELNTLERGMVTVHGTTRKGTEESESFAFGWDDKQPSLKEWRRITKVDATDLESTVTLEVRSSDCKQGPYWSFWNNRYADDRNKVDEFWDIDTDSPWRNMQNLPVTRLWDIAYGNGWWIAVGNNGKILRTQDFVSISTVTLSGAPMIGSIYYADGKWVIATETNIRVSTNDGLNWTTKYNDGRTYTGLMYVAGLWVAGGDGQYILTSPDAEVWTRRTPGSGFISKRLYLGKSNLIISAGNAGTNYNAVIDTTTDGTTWTRVWTGGIYSYIYSIIYDPVRDYYIMSYYTALEGNVIKKSTNLTSWTTIYSSGSNRFQCITLDDNNVLTAIGSDYAYKSYDGGYAWYSQTLPLSCTHSAIAHNNGIFGVAGYVEAGTASDITYRSGSGTTTLERIGHIATDWKQLVQGFSQKEVKDSWELLDNTDSNLDEILDVAIQPFTDRMWVLGFNKYLYCYDLSEDMVNSTLLEGSTPGAEVQIDVDSRSVLLGEDIVFRPMHLRISQEISSFKVWWQDPAGTKYNYSTPAIKPSDIKRFISDDYTVTASQRGEWVLAVETTFSDGTIQTHKVVVMVQYKKPIATISIASLIQSGHTLVGLEFDSDQHLQIKATTQSTNYFYRIGLHTDVMLVDYENKTIFLKEDYDNVGVTVYD